MPVDLDELFSDLGRQADAIPAPAASAARRRGDQRNRNRVVVAAAAAVVMVVSGLGVALRLRTDHAKPVLPAAPTVRGLAPAGPPIKLYGPASDHMFNISQLDGDRLYVGSGDLDGTLEVVGLDTRTGKKLWTAPRITPFFETNGPIATPRAVLIAVGSQYRVHDPVTGRKLRQFRQVTDSTLIVHDDVLVEVTRAGLTRATGLLTGKELWRAQATGTDRPRVSVGMQTGTEWSHPADNSRSVQLSDGRLAQLTGGGKLLVRDVRTGQVRSSRQTEVEVSAGYWFDTLNELVVLPESNDRNGHRLTVVDTGTGTIKVVWSSRKRGYMNHFLCGPQLICLSEFQGTVVDESARLTAISTVDGATLWSTPARLEAFAPAGRNGRVAGDDGSTGPVLYGADGALLFTRQGVGSSTGWVDDTTVLSVVPDASTAGHKILAIRATDGAVTELATLPRSHFGGCVWDSATLACRTGVDLHIWRFTR